jgi:hypothetical protein
MNYWIRDYRAKNCWNDRDWDFLLINDSEARMLSGEHNLRRAPPGSWKWDRARWW